MPGESSTTPIHWCFDNTLTAYRKGTLHFYNNTYACPCGATKDEYRERGSVAGLSSLMTPGACRRSWELANGAEPVNSDEIREAEVPGCD